MMISGERKQDPKKEQLHTGPRRGISLALTITEILSTREKLCSSSLHTRLKANMNGYTRSTLPWPMKAYRSRYYHDVNHNLNRRLCESVRLKTKRPGRKRTRLGKDRVTPYSTLQSHNTILDSDILKWH